MDNQGQNLSPENSSATAFSDVFVQKYSTELLKCIDEMKLKRDQLHLQILKETGEQEKIKNDVRHLTTRLSRVNESLSGKLEARGKLDLAIQEADNAFSGLVKGSEDLLSLVKRVSNVEIPKPRTFPSTEEDLPKIEITKSTNKRKMPKRASNHKTIIQK
ncbi:hypothetical protein CHS0354_004264 [Potamilus streckersoni]|uniref:Uncharacterized protein n=1 Tax=Potamilus streckersoni TaxID=2493646 RepID=A0AAE0VQ40_9BIVA|nr:hypothetical protein CHS0354_004264 [Potamilus streckersoni]